MAIIGAADAGAVAGGTVGPDKALRRAVLVRRRHQGR